MSQRSTLRRSAPHPCQGVLRKYYDIHMKRTNLVLDERLLSEATTVLEARTYSAAVNTALEEVIRLRKIQNLPSSFGSGIWEGNFSQMREDHPRRAPKRQRRSR